MEIQTREYIKIIITLVDLACPLAGGREANRLLQVALINPTTHLLLAAQAGSRCHGAIGGSGG